MIYLVRIWPAPGLVNQQFEAAVLNNELDWIRFDEMTWFVRSMRTANQLSALIAPVVGPLGRHLVIQVERLNAQGQMAPAVWNWINAGN